MTTLSERVQRLEGPRAKQATKKNANWNQAKRRARDALLESMGPELYVPATQQQLERVVAERLDEALETSGVKVPAAQRMKFVAEVAADILGYGPLDQLMSDPTITEIMCNAHDDIYIERGGRIEHTNLAFIDTDQFRQVIAKIVAQAGRRLDESSPMVDARLRDGSRVNAVIPPVSVQGPVLTIRRFPESPFAVKDLISLGSLSVDAAVFLETTVRGKCNVAVSGGTGTGKTTMLNVVSSFVPERERIVTIEDAAELRLAQPHVVAMEARPANAEGAGAVTIRDMVRNALRMRPDRIVVGEVRGAEALDMLQAMNTGHEGSMTTLHANSPRDALSRLETMVLMAGYDLPLRAIRQQIASAIDLIVHIDRMPDGARRVTHICEVQGMEGEVITLQDIFRTHPSTGKLKATGLRPKLAERLASQGLPIAPRLFGGAA